MANETIVANTILDQLGRNRFIAMTGARNLVGHHDGLTFKLRSNFAKSGINHVSIRLNPYDLYNVVFSRVYGIKATTIFAVDNAFAKDLTQIFTDITGLDVRL